MLERIYFDACVFIELLQQSDAVRFDACEALRVKALREELIIVTSSWSIVEVNKLPPNPKDPQKSRKLPKEKSKQILAFFENPYIAIRTLDRQTAEYAHEIVQDYGLSNGDATHVATAILNKVPVLYTYDGCGGKKGLLDFHLRIGSPPLRIEMPPDPDDKTLFSKKVLDERKQLE